MVSLEETTIYEDPPKLKQLKDHLFCQFSVHCFVSSDFLYVGIGELFVSAAEIDIETRSVQELQNQVNRTLLTRYLDCIFLLS